MWVGASFGGGQEFLIKANEGPNRLKYYPFNFCFRPEISTVPLGTSVSLKITRLTGAANLTIGTGGTTASFIELRYFLEDPLKGRLFIDYNRIQIPLEESRGEASLGGGWLPLAFGLLSRPRRRALAVAMCLAATGMAACVGTPSPDGTAEPSDGTSKPTNGATFRITDEPSGGAGRTVDSGSIHGVVKRELGLPLRGASVSLMETSFYHKTGGDGTFLFANVTSGQHQIHIDAPTYAVYDGPVTVEAGKRTEFEIEMTPAVDPQADFKAHPHDDWEGKAEATIFSDTFTPQWVYRDPVTELFRTFDSALAASFQGPDTMDDAPNPETLCGMGSCEAKVRLPYGAVVKPGTGRVEVSLMWTAEPGTPREVGLKVLVPANKTFGSLNKVQILLPRASPATFQVPIFPRESDPAHQRFTDWEFTLYIPVTEQNHPYGPPLVQAVDVTMAIKIFKAVIPYEPAHLNQWDGRTSIDLIPVASTVSGCFNSDTPSEVLMWTVTGKDPAGKNRLVPIGTKEVVGRLNWSSYQTSAALKDLGLPGLSTKWTLQYRGADQPPGSLSPNAVEETGGGPGYWTFKITPSEKEPDQVYQTKSKWRFYVENRDDNGNKADCATGMTFELTATAIRDPSK